MTDQEKAYISLRKYYLAMQHKLTKFKLGGKNPPDYLQKNLQDLKRKLHLFEKSLKQ